MTDPLALAVRAQTRATAADNQAKAFRAERDAALVAAFRTGLRPPSIAKATGIDVWLVRKILRAAGVLGSKTEESSS